MIPRKIRPDFLGVAYFSPKKIPMKQTNHPISKERFQLSPLELPAPDPETCLFIAIPSMSGIFTYIYHKSQPNVGKYTIHGWYGIHASGNQNMTTWTDFWDTVSTRSDTRGRSPWNFQTVDPTVARSFFLKPEKLRWQSRGRSFGSTSMVFFLSVFFFDFPGKMWPDSVGLGKHIFKIWNVLIEYMTIYSIDVYKYTK